MMLSIHLIFLLLHESGQRLLFLKKLYLYYFYLDIEGLKLLQWLYMCIYIYIFLFVAYHTELISVKLSMALGLPGL